MATTYTDEQSRMWDQRYAQPGAFGEEPNDFLRSQEKWFHTGQSVLSLGEGEGRNAIWLAQRGVRVTAVDLSSVGLSRAAEKAAQLGLPITTIQADLAHWRLGEARWDVIISIWCHMPSVVRRLVHRQTVEALRPDGAFILEAYTPKQIGLRTGGPSSPDLLPTAANLVDELSGLEIVSCCELRREVREGRHHGGMSEVVQFVAKKTAPTPTKAQPVVPGS